MRFTDFNLVEPLQQGISEAGFEECTPVQSAVFKEILEGKDICAQSQTGTGKTAAFLISMFQLMLTSDEFKDRKALIIVPTRELALQVEEEANRLGKHLGFLTASILGGVEYRKQEDLLKKNPNIIVGTPGRILDFVQSKKLDFSNLGILVIDEADRLFDMGFLPDLRKILKNVPGATKRRTMLFSATLSCRVHQLAWEYMNNSAEIEIAPETITVEAIEQEMFHVARNEKMSLLLGIIKKYNPGSAIIFTNTRHGAAEISKRLEYNGIKCQYISGELPQRKRIKIIESIKNGMAGFLVATDVAARGLHIDDLEMVINYDIPEDSENYVHRIGRTARAGKSGRAFSLACERYVYGLPAIENYINMKIPVGAPGEDMFVKDESEGVRIPRDRHGSPRGNDGRRGGESRRNKERSRERGRERLKGVAREGTNKNRDHERNRKKTSKPREQVRRSTTAGKSQKAAITKTASGKDRNELKDRLEFYRKKYGEDFKITHQSEADTKKRRKPKNPKKGKVKTNVETKPKKKGILQWFMGLFQKKK